MQNEIPAYKDETFLGLTEKLAFLDEEANEFLLNQNIIVTSRGKTRVEVYDAKVKTYTDLRDYLKTAYPNNSVADKLIARCETILSKEF